MNQQHTNNKKDLGKLLDSNYDGIQEYDNDLPRWWVWLFWGSIVFGVFYSAYYHFGPGLSSTEHLALEMENLNKLKVQVAAQQAPAQSAALDQVLFSIAADPAGLAKGKSVFDAKCLACHGNLGQGLIGPNLTDDYWIHGGSITDILKVVEEGVLDKGMLAWKSLLPREDIYAVTGYIWSLHGSNPPGPKEPQGTLMPRKS